VLGFLLQPSPLLDWQAGLPRHRPRGGLLLRAAGDDQGPQRGLGVLGPQPLMTTNCSSRRSSSTTATSTRAPSRSPPGQINP
jgi:hypothetical protein